MLTLQSDDIVLVYFMFRMLMHHRLSFALNFLLIYFRDGEALLVLSLLM